MSILTLRQILGATSLFIFMLLFVWFVIFILDLSGYIDLGEISFGWGELPDGSSIDISTGLTVIISFPLFIAIFSTYIFYKFIKSIGPIKSAMISMLPVVLLCVTVIIFIYLVEPLAT